MTDAGLVLLGHGSRDAAGAEEFLAVAAAVQAALAALAVEAGVLEFAGPVQGDISSRRAMIENAEQRGNTQVIDATVPLASMFGYATILRSLTQGRATYTMEPHSYAQVPTNVQAEILAALK